MRRTVLAWSAALGVVLGLLASLSPPVDAARNSSGTYSLPSGNPVVSGTTITSTWANNTLADLGTELTNSLDRNGRGAMLAPLKLPDGTNSAPAATFSSESGLGFFRPSTGVIGATGPVSLSSVGNPAATTAQTSRITPKNIIKAWALLSTNAGGAVTVLDGFNVASAAVNGIYVDVTMASPMSSTSYAVFVNGNGGGSITEGGYGYAVSTTVARVGLGNISLGGQSRLVNVMVLGAQ